MTKLSIRSQAMLGTSHSWAVTMRSLLTEFRGMGHDLYLNSINGYDMVPLAWHSFKKNIEKPDIDITYTLPRNFDRRFSGGSKLKLAIYNYETSVLPKEWKGLIKHVDYVLPSSEFSKKVFVDAGWPEEKCIVVPHGIRISDFCDKSKVRNIKTKKSFKFLNISIPHYRKNIYTLLDAYYSEFSDKDDVCLILKTSTKKPKYRFECDAVREVLKAQKKHRKIKGSNLAQVEIIKEKYDSIVPLYNSCDCLVSATSSEGFGLPLLEALASGLLVIAPHCTGQADFLNNNNSLPVDFREVAAPERYQYWKASPGSKMYMSDVDSLAHNMRLAYENKDRLAKSFSTGVRQTLSEFTWKNAAKKILEIA